jgi:hypothetical protein
VNPITVRIVIDSVVTVLTCSPGGTPASVTVVVADASSRMIDGKIGRNARLEFMIFVLRRRALFADLRLRAAPHLTNARNSRLFAHGVFWSRLLTALLLTRCSRRLTRLG